MPAVSAPDRIDCDVHPPVPTVQQLAPYLTAHWRDYLAETGFRYPSATNYSYPSTSAVMARAADAGFEPLCAAVFARSERAVVNCFYGAEGIRHPYLAAALCEAVDRWIQAEWLDREPRFLASIVVPAHDTDTAVKEIRRLRGDRRFVQVLLAARAWEPYGNHRYWPIWEAAADQGLALGIHFGGLTGHPATSVGTPETYFEEYATATQVFASHVMSLIVEGVFDRYPSLRVCLLESGAAWLPTWLWKLDTDWKATRREIPWVRRRPMEYARDHVRLTIQPFDVPARPKLIREWLDQLGSDEMLLYSSDHPHEHGSDPEALLSALRPDEHRKVVRDNALSLYQLAATATQM